MTCRKTLRRFPSSPIRQLRHRRGGQDAIEQAVRVHPDAIILDMNMPDQDGLVRL